MVETKKRAGGRLNRILNGFKDNQSDDKTGKKVIRVAFAGNPNAGKTSLFNNITGQRQHIGNYPGVTVEKKTGYSEHKGFRIEIVDLPGTYSLTAYSPEEIVTRDYILNDSPDIVVDIIDSTNLERNLFLCLQFRELGVPVIGALNMSDEAENIGINIDVDHLSRILDIPFVKTVGHKGSGIETLLDLVVSTHQNNESKSKRVLNYGREIEGQLEKLSAVLSEDPEFTNIFPLRWIAIKLIENDQDVIEKLKKQHKLAELVLRRVNESQQWIQKHFREEPNTVVAEQRYAYIHGAVRETVKKTGKLSRRTFTEQLDKIVLNRFAGMFIFFLMMFLVYQVTFSLGNPLSDLIDTGFSNLGSFIGSVMPEGAARDLIVDGIIGGVGGVLVFLPIVLLLFLSLSFLEDSGYMARAAFVMDKFFHMFGMHGRSFIPFMIATGCAVPAVMSARTLVNPRDRKITILVTPIMMCGAKSPVIAMLTAAFFPKNAGLVFWLVWLTGWMIAFIMAYIFRKTLFKGDAAPFVMELPPYRFPTLRGIISHMWDKGSMYLRKAGTIILAVSIVIWFFLYYPKPAEYSIDYDAEIQKISDQFTSSLIDEDGSSIQENDPVILSGLEAERDELIAQLENQKASEEIEASIGGRIGKAIEPVFKTAGFDWRIGVSLFAGFAAKEVIVATMGIVYGIADEGEESVSLRERISLDPAYNPAMALAMMFFVLIYIPCMAVLAVVKKELGGWRWPIFVAVYTLAVAWGVATGVYHLASLFGLGA